MKWAQVTDQAAVNLEMVFSIHVGTSDEESFYLQFQGVDKAASLRIHFQTKEKAESLLCDIMAEEQS